MVEFEIPDICLTWAPYLLTEDRNVQSLALAEYSPLLSFAMASTHALLSVRIHGLWVDWVMYSDVPYNSRGYYTQNSNRQTLLFK